ncbi:hypothetical protein PVAP13_2NG317706 [Panicum virgatum]|uniref:Zinc finger GRF-type domain-containing protein n=1 Tax=Panicum virgatum TaxID=38727 RepID=A0A8T0VI77_PANVG|nr:hypothetical protein PVAP13_2NG317706 [Panicum virgatum]
MANGGHATCAQQRADGAPSPKLNTALCGLPLIPCPDCGDQVVECKSWKHNGRLFFKNIRYDEHVPGRCGFFRWLEQIRSIVVAKEKQLMQALAAKEQDLKQVCPSTSGFHIRSSMCDEGKIDKLINLV